MGGTQKCCLACGMVTEITSELISCITPQCKGMYCSQCFNKLNSICTICMSPLAFHEDNEEELDSSDDETVGLWTAGLKTLKHTELEQKGQMRKLLKKRIKEALRKKVRAKPGFSKESLEKGTVQHNDHTSKSDTSSNITSQSSVSFSELDHDYQKNAVWDSSNNSDNDPQAFLEHYISQEQVSLQDLRDSSSKDNGHRQEEQLH
ncbi:DC-STAMP domain-containing protein 2-like [Amia ocellicauda]|uniref:DC-STAMP domain-containing protein 2-like n=1 Tax=Amia ocellicauda TaxID=2972642 RepID=UPI003463BA1C